MLDWIAGYVARWTGYVEDNTRSLVQWGLHALAGVVYTVFHNVSGAWTALGDALHYLQVEAAGFSAFVVGHLAVIVKVDLPRLWAYAVAAFKAAEYLAGQYYRLSIAAVRVAEQQATTQTKQTVQWVITHVYDPLADLAKQLRADLLKWGYTAWWYITHPDKLAPVLLGALIAAAEDTFFAVAAPAGKFALRLIVHQLPQLLRLAEAIITAVL